MTTELTGITLLGIVAAGFTILLWAYWSLVLPSIRRQLEFRVETALDRVRILGLSREIIPGSKLYVHIVSFLSEALAAMRQDTWVTVTKATPEEVKRRKILLRALWEEMDQQNPELKSLVNEGWNALISLYVAQRPFVVCALIPLKALSYFVQRFRSVVADKEADFAATSLAGGCALA